MKETRNERWQKVGSFNSSDYEQPRRSLFAVYVSCDIFEIIVAILGELVWKEPGGAFSTVNTVAANSTSYNVTYEFH